jgi:hypothetical protein
MSLWTVFFKSHPINSTDSNSDNLLQDYFMNCITVCLKTEVIEEFYELPGDEQGAPLLIYLALTKASLQLSKAALPTSRSPKLPMKMSLHCSLLRLKSIAKHLR